MIKYLSETQERIYQNAKNKLSPKHCPLITNKDKLFKHFSTESPSPVLIYWHDDDEIEKDLQEQFKVSIRCYPEVGIFNYDENSESLFDVTKTGQLALLAKAY